MDDEGRGALGTIVVVALLAAIVYGAMWVAGGGRPLIDAGPLSGIFAGDSIRRNLSAWFNGGQMPTPGVDAEESRVLAKVRPPVPAGEYAFLQSSSEGPVTYSPCRRLEVVVNLRGAPPDAMPAIQDAVGQVSRASGLALTVSGDTNEPYRDERKPFQPNRYGDRWAPILVAWAGPGAIPEFEEGAVGFGGSVAIDTVLGDPSYVTGSVVLDREFFADPANQGYLTEVMLHELGHVLGLDHVSDDEQVMWVGGLHGAGLGSGDLAGLARLGRGPCTPDL